MAIPYRRVLNHGWNRFLKGKTCAVLGPPWGVQFPTPGPGEVDLPGPPDPERYYGSTRAAFYDKALWRWAAKKDSTLVWALDAHSKARHLEMAWHAAGVVFDYGNMRGVADTDLSSIDSLHMPWWIALHPLLRRASIEFDLTPYDEDDERRGNSPRPSKPPIPVPGKVKGHRLLIHPHGIDSAGMVLMGTVGRGRIAFLPLRMPKDNEGADTLRRGVAHLHLALRGVQSTLPAMASSADAAPVGSNDDGPAACSPASVIPPDRALPDQTTRVTDTGGSLTLEKVAERLNRIQLEDENDWTSERVRKRLRKPDTDFFRELAAMRIGGRKKKIPRRPFESLVASASASRVEDVEGVKRTLAEERRLKKADGRHPALES